MSSELTLGELRMREVIRVCDGKSLGCVCDLRIDPCSGRVSALEIFEGDFRSLFGGFGKRRFLRIPWEKIRCIGEDAILVELCPEECTPGKR